MILSLGIGLGLRDMIFNLYINGAHLGIVLGLRDRESDPVRQALHASVQSFGTVREVIKQKRYYPTRHCAAFSCAIKR